MITATLPHVLHLLPNFSSLAKSVGIPSFHLGPKSVLEWLTGFLISTTKHDKGYEYFRCNYKLHLQTPACEGLRTVSHCSGSMSPCCPMSLRNPQILNLLDSEGNYESSTWAKRGQRPKQEQEERSSMELDLTNSPWREMQESFQGLSPSRKLDWIINATKPDTSQLPGPQADSKASLPQLYSCLWEDSSIFWKRLISTGHMKNSKLIYSLHIKRLRVAL